VNMEEEKRLCYVAMTRAKSELVMVSLSMAIARFWVLSQQCEKAPRYYQSLYYLYLTFCFH